LKKVSPLPFPNSKLISLVVKQECESLTFKGDFWGDILSTLSPSLAVNPFQAAQDIDPLIPR